MSTTTPAPPPPAPAAGDAGATGARGAGGESRAEGREGRQGRDVREVREVRDLDVPATLAAAAAARRSADQHEADLLRLAVHLVDLHPIDPHDTTTPLATWEDPTLTTTHTGSGTGSGAGAGAGTGAGRVGHGHRRLAGPGTPAVSEHAVQALGATLGISYRAALRLVADALELHYRLPRLWALLTTGHLQAWKARQIATLTTQLTTPAVAFVDHHAALPATHNRLPAHLPGLIHQALLRYEPDTAHGHEQAALDHREVTLEHRGHTTAATATMTATLDLADAIDLETTITHLAATLAHLGDPDPLGARRAHALGLLAHPQRTLTLLHPPPPPPDTDPHTPTTPTSQTSPTTPASPAGQPSPPPQPRQPWQPANTLATTLYVHCTLADLATSTSAGASTSTSTSTAVATHTGAGTTAATQAQTGAGAARIEKLGITSLTLLRDLLQRTSKVTVRPVLDPTATTQDVDAHDPPTCMREAVTLRDGHCVFPGCTTDARRCDLDHITPYHHPTPNPDPDRDAEPGGPSGPPGHPPQGPPGQTTTTNLAPLCRRHHRLKTHTAWHYQRLPDGTYHWTDPHGTTYLTSPHPKA